MLHATVLDAPRQVLLVHLVWLQATSKAVMTPVLQPGVVRVKLVGHSVLLEMQ